MPFCYVCQCVKPKNEMGGCDVCTSCLGMQALANKVVDEEFWNLIDHAAPTAPRPTTGTCDQCQQSVLVLDVTGGRVLLEITPVSAWHPPKNDEKLWAQQSVWLPHKCPFNASK